MRLTSIFPHQKSHLPGRAVNLTFSLTYLTLLIIVPIGCLVSSIHQMPFSEIYRILSSERALHAFKISFSLAFLAALVDLCLGVIIAWVLVKYEFFGKKFLDSIIDLPFAMPTAISGIALATLYSEDGWIGKFAAIAELKISYTAGGILIALVFIGLPFVVRAVQPAIQALDDEMEEAAASLGASRGTIFRKIILPQLLPSMITGFTMSLARGLGEYGSVIFIAGNIPLLTEILPLLIVINLEQFDYQGATTLATAMLSLSLVLLITLGVIGKQIRKRIS